MTDLKHIHKVSRVKSGEWATVCPICGTEMDEFEGELESYEANCENCERWYFLSDAIAHPVGASYELGQLQKRFENIIRNEAKYIRVLKSHPYRDVEQLVENPSQHRMKQTLSLIKEE